MNTASVMELVQVSRPTAGRALDALVEAGILVETTGRRRDRSHAWQAYLDVLRVCTDLGEEEGPR